MPKVSVVMASYNHEKFVAETIQSVLDQTYQDFEFIITDDGSPDRTVDVIKKFDDPRIKLFCFPQNQGACAAMNNCINEAKGEYIAVINSDDAWLPEKLEKQVKFLDEHQEIGAVFTSAQIMDENSNDFPDKDHWYQKIFIQPNRNRFQWLKHFFFYCNCLCHPSVLIRKQCYAVTGVYDERYAQLPDWDFWIRLCMRYDIHIMPENLTKFRLRANEANASGNRADVATRTTLEISQVLRNYLNPLVIEEFLKIFPLMTNIPEVGVSASIGEIETELVPFFLAKMALQIEGPALKYFGFELLYQMCSNAEIAGKLKNKYSFDFNSLTGLATQQDIFGIISSRAIQANYNQAQSELEQTRSELTQSQSELEQTRSELIQYQSVLKQAEMLRQQSELVLAQYHHRVQENEIVLKEYQETAEQTRSDLEKSQAQLLNQQEENNQLLSLLQQLQTQLRQTEAVVEESNQQLQQSRWDLENSQAQLLNQQEENNQLLSLLEQSQTQLRQTEAVVEESNQQLQQSRSDLEKSQAQFLNQQEENNQLLSLLEQSQTQLRQTETILVEYQTKLQKTHQGFAEFQQLGETKDELLNKSTTEIEELKKLVDKLHQILQVKETMLSQFHQQMAALHAAKQQLKEQLNYQQTESTNMTFNLAKLESQLHQKQSEIDQNQKQLYRLRFERFLASDNTNSPKQTQYRLLVWEAWYAYQHGDYRQMVKSLQQSLQHTPLSRTETMVNWLESFANFSSENGSGFDSSQLLGMSEWQQLTRQSILSKVR
ncbi:glycosyltransferase [Microcoleus sp. Z1_B2]|uniref:glycosyltransferase n=1 Tax=Microcoleus sp. Z1_B2 TaxID=3055429 RepID=UPI002FCF975C